LNITYFKLLGAERASTDNKFIYFFLSPDLDFGYKAGKEDLSFYATNEKSNGRILYAWLSSFISCYIYDNTIFFGSSDGALYVINISKD